VDEPTRGLEFHIHGLIGLIYEAAMDVDLWPALLRTLYDVLEHAEPPQGELVALAEAVNGTGQALVRELPAMAEAPPLALALSGVIRSHFSRALDLNHQLKRQRQHSDILGQLFERFPLGVVMVAVGGEVLQQNAQFEQLLHSDRRLRVNAGRLGFSDRATQQAWQEALAQLAAGEAASAVIPVSRQDTAPLSAMLLAYDSDEAPGNRCLLLCLAAPGVMGQVPERELAEMFALTGAESRLLAALVNGYSPEEYSEEAGVSSNTVRSHLKALFRKTGTSRQGEVVRRVLNSPAVLAGKREDAASRGVISTPRDAKRQQQGIRLDDGRWLSYAEYGPADGRPLLFAHGLTGSRLQSHPDDSALYQQGIRLLVPDRPGFGLSDIDTQRSVLDWADDVAQLLDRLGLARVGAMGFSVGGIFAMALGRVLPQRIEQLTLVSSMGSYTETADLDGMIPRNRMILILGRHMPAILTPFMQLMIDSLRRNPKQYFDDLVKNLPAFERHYLRHPAMKATITRAFTEATRNGVAGLVYEQMLISRPWGFHPAEVTVPVRLWHGEQDVHVPLSMNRRLIDELPCCDAHLLKDSGHFLLYDRWADIVAAMS